MTENEAKNVLDNVWDFAILSDDESGDILEKAIDIANKALEEIQQYRAIGTVEGYEKAIQATTEYYLLMKEYKSKVQDFEAIGTIDEFKALKKEVELYRNLDKTNFSDGYAKAIDEFASTLIPRLTDAIYQKDVESMTNLINDVARELKAGDNNE